MKAIFVLFLLPLRLFSQDLSGIWVGTIATSETQMPFELAINQDMTGYSMVTFMFKGAEKTAVKKIVMIRKDSTFTISDDKVIYNNFATRSRSIKTFCELSIKIVDSNMVLSGPFHTRTRDLRAGDEDLSSGTITLKKKNNQAQTKLINKLDSLKLSNTLAFSDPKPTNKEIQAVAVREKELPPASKKEAPAVAVSEKVTPTVVVPKKEGPVAAVPEKQAPAVSEPQVKDLTAAKVKQQVSSQKGKGDSLKLSSTPVFSNPKPIIKQTPAEVVPKKETPAVAVSEKATPTVVVPKKEAPVVAVPEKETPAVAEPQVKDLTAVKVKQQVSSEKGKNELNSYTPNNISTASSILTDQKIIAAAADIALRKIEVIRTIDFKSDSLTLILYDNGVVDGDTVSVVLNDVVIIPKQGLAEQAYRKVIKIPPGLGDSLRLVIYAENLGSIPPNSGLLIIEDGSDRHQVGFEGDMKKSAAVILRRQR